MYQIIANIFKYGFVIVVYMFIYSVIKLIYLDITDTRRMQNSLDGALAYLKTITLAKDLDFKVFDSYGLKETTVIGRSKKCEIFIKDPFMSKENTVIYHQDGVFRIKDLGSTNGTYVNGKQLLDKPVKLKDSDKITVGGIDFIFVDPYALEGRV